MSGLFIKRLKEQIVLKTKKVGRKAVPISAQDRYVDIMVKHRA